MRAACCVLVFYIGERNPQVCDVSPREMALYFRQCVASIDGIQSCVLRQIGYQPFLHRIAMTCLNPVSFSHRRCGCDNSRRPGAADY